MNQNPKKLLLLVCSVVLVVFMMCGCSMQEDATNGKQLCEKFIDYVIENDYNSAYNMVSAVASKDEFDALWTYVHPIFENTTSYELKQTGWNKKWSNDITLIQVAYEATTNDGKVCQLTVSSIDDMKTIYGLHILDSTEFVKRTSYISAVNVVFMIISLVGFAFSIWMLIDCIKRRMKNKVLWIILIFVGVSFGITIGQGTFGTKFVLSLILALSSITADNTTLAVTTNIALPVGAIIYLFMRKKLTLPEPNTVETDYSVSEIVEPECENKNLPQNTDKDE